MVPGSVRRYLKGTYLWGQRLAEEAIVELKASVEIDQDFADAHTALADAWAVHGYYGGVPTWGSVVARACGGR